MSDTALNLTISVASSTVSQLESVKVVATLENRGPPAVVPSAYDLSGALSFSFRMGDRVVRRASGLTQQELMVLGRVDPTPSEEELGAGARWTAALDLGQSTYAPPPGRYRFTAELALPSGERLASNDIDVTVVPDPVQAAVAVRDNPVLDGLAVVFERSHPSERWFMRQYNTARPLGPWYGEGLSLGARPILAQRAFFSSQSFDHFFERWLVWIDGGRVVARAFVNGRPTEGSLEAPLPAGVRMLGSALDHGGGRIEVFVLQAGDVVCVALEPGMLRERWRLSLPDGTRDPAVTADASAYHVAVARAGLSTARIGRSGGVEPWEQRFNTDLDCASLWMDPVDHRVLASFWDGPKGRHLQMIEASTDSPRVSLLYREREGSLSALRELAFDCSDTGEFHALAHAEDGLFYARHAEPPTFVAPRAPQRVPLVVARPAAYLGYYDAERGYHFYEVKRGCIVYRDLDGTPA